MFYLKIYQFIFIFKILHLYELQKILEELILWNRFKEQRKVCILEQCYLQFNCVVLLYSFGSNLNIEATFIRR